MNDRSTRLPRQEALFDDSRESNASVLVTVRTSAGRLSATQRTFNRLTQRVRRGRDSLAAWEAFIPRFQSRVLAELQPIEDELRGAQRRLALRLEALLVARGNGERLTRKDRSRVRSLILELIEDLLKSGPDAELEALYGRYSNSSHAERRRQDVEDAAALFGGIFGPEIVQGHEAENVEELLRHAGEKFAQSEARQRRDSARRARRGGQPGTALRQEQAAEEAGRSVREIFRKLASALHPDRETDAAERERKTVLMQRANRAYECNDLLELLALQIETEQIDPGALADVPEARLRHYNEVLREQAEALEAQVQEQVAMFRVTFDLTAYDLTPQNVEQALGARIVQARAFLRDVERDIGRLDDPLQRRTVLDELTEMEEVTDFAGLAALEAAFEETLGHLRPGPRRRGRRGR